VREGKHTFALIEKICLPINAILSRLDSALTDNLSAVVVAPPGSGKTTRVPLALMGMPWLAGKKIIMLEPRRIAARLAAEFMAGLLGEQVGEKVGYQVRFDRRISRQTRIEVITEGLLTRRLQQDPGLEDVGLVIFDEFHERSLDADLALALCLDVCSALRDDLRLLVMSATMDPGPVSRLLGNAPVITGEGRTHPVTISHIPPPPRFDSSAPAAIAGATVTAIRQVILQEQGDILVFLPGIGEIRRVSTQLSSLQDCIVRPLHGAMNPAAQEQAIVPDKSGRQRIILATTIAETSVTIEGITVVIDCGWKRVPRYHPSTGLAGLDTVRISRASAEQRAGRAGRLAPGSCYRLWHTGVEAGLAAFDKPEVFQADLTPLVLELASWGVHKPDELCWLDPPPSAAFLQGKQLLQDLGALDDQGKITTAGRKIGALPLHPRLATMIYWAGSENFGQAVDLAALLSERDPLPGVDTADIDERLYCLQRYRSQGKKAVQAMGANPGVCAAINRVSRQLHKIASCDGQRKMPLLSTGGILALAYPDRIGGKRNRDGYSYQLASGTGAALSPHDPLTVSNWLVVASQNMRSGDGRIFLAAALSEEELYTVFTDRLQQCNEVFWDSRTQKVVSRQCVRLGKLVVSQQRLSTPDPQAIAMALTAGIRDCGIEVLPWTSVARQLQARVCCLGEWLPNENWPDFSDKTLLETLEEWLAPFLHGMTSLKAVVSLRLDQVLMSRLDYDQQQRLERDAPIYVTVPSGSQKRLVYHPENPPVLAVRLQEMFGLAETPTVCRGNIKVLLHLLSPAQRPVQVTRDLQGFWKTSYFAVRKEMKGRYPKHHWPEEPWKAEATARIKRRKKKK
jgi:ATP-dependent helicase HrpB